MESTKQIEVYIFLPYFCECWYSNQHGLKLVSCSTSGSCLSFNIWANEYLNNFVLYISNGIKLALFLNSFNWFARRQSVFRPPLISRCTPPWAEFQLRRPGLKHPLNFETTATVNISSWRLRLFRYVMIFVCVVV